VRMPVPRPVADRVQQMKAVATAARDSELAFTRTVLADLRKATALSRKTVELLDEEGQAARKAGASKEELTAMTAIQRAARREAAEQFNAGVQQVLGPVRDKLTAAEHAAMRELEERPGIAPSEADYRTATDLAHTLDLLPPIIAAKILQARLATEPARTGKGLGLTAAMVPLVRGKMADPRFEECREFRDVLTTMQVVLRDSGYYKAHQTLAAVGTLRAMQAALAMGGYRNPDAAEINPAYIAFGAKPVPREGGAPTYRNGERVA
jgi:hypothetical protein